MKNVIALTMAMVIAAPQIVAAQQVRCLKRDDMVSKLGVIYSETPEAAGVTKNGGVVELLKTHDGDTWSLIMTYPNGVSCMIAAGEAWHKLIPREVTPEKPIS